MNVPNSLSFARIALSPLFFVVFFADTWFGATNRVALLVALWILFAVIETTDLLDGYLARRHNLETDLGKILDPFADSLSRLTYFSCYAIAGIMPGWIFLIVLYRDLGVAFVRQNASSQGRVMASRLSGKLKALVYALGGAAGLASVSFDGSDIPALGHVIDIVFYLCGAIAVWSLIDYSLSLRTGR